MWSSAMEDVKGQKAWQKLYKQSKNFSSPSSDGLDDRFQKSRLYAIIGLG
uniref:Uncharacterized protein n=1 Tax=Arundo donax TaxID=35708 RepID=A0A0A9DR95_ARUDO